MPRRVSRGAKRSSKKVAFTCQRCHSTQNPKPLNPRSLNPQTLNPKPLNPKPLNPQTRHNGDHKKSAASSRQGRAGPMWQIRKWPQNETENANGFRVLGLGF